MNDSDNPLLDFTGLPRFADIRTEHIAPAVDTLLGEARTAVESVATDTRPATWDNVAEPIADALERLDRAWGAVRHLNAVVNTPPLREAYNACLPKVTAFFSDLGSNLRLFAKYRVLRNAPTFSALEPAQRKVIDNELRDFKLGGAELPDERKARLKVVHEELADLGSQFEEHLLDATNAWAHYVQNEAELAGVPADVIQAARAAAQAEGKSGCKLTLRMPCFLPVMQYAHERKLRRLLHEAYATRASDLGATREWDNGPVIDGLLVRRREEAELL